MSSRRFTSSARPVAEAAGSARGSARSRASASMSAPIRSNASFELDRVAPRLVHLAAGLVEDVLVGRARAGTAARPDERHRHEALRVEPEADLLAPLRDPVGREPLLPVRVVGQVGAGQALRRAGRVAVLDPLRVLPAERREVDDAGVEPGVADLRDPLDLLVAALAADRHLVDPRPVQLLELVEARRRRAPRARRASRSRSGARTRTGRTAAAGRSSACARCSSRPCCGSQSSIRFLYCGGVHSTVALRVEHRLPDLVGAR